MHFVDECTIRVQAGDGGPGCAAFRRAANQPRGGPCGGDGGRGGSIILEASPHLRTLVDLAYRREYKAPSGEPGQGRDCHGKQGQDVLISVPVGTLVKDTSGALLCDLSEVEQRFVAAQGGQGGWGNLHFVSSTNQAPQRCDPGEPGQERTIVLELQLLADVGLVGFPNAGKSSFIAACSAARPKIAGYPFTTLVPQLGVVRLPLHHPRPSHSMVVADIPGLIEGAHAGKGLGHQFLRHIQRTRALIVLLDIADEPGRDPWQDYNTLQHELASFDPALKTRPHLIALNKTDLPDVAAAFSHWQAVFRLQQLDLHPLSTATQTGMSVLLEDVYRMVKTQENVK